MIYIVTDAIIVTYYYGIVSTFHCCIHRNIFYHIVLENTSNTVPKNLY